MTANYGQSSVFSAVKMLQLLGDPRSPIRALPLDPVL